MILSICSEKEKNEYDTLGHRLSTSCLAFLTSLVREDLEKKHLFADIFLFGCLILSLFSGHNTSNIPINCHNTTSLVFCFEYIIN